MFYFNRKTVKTQWRVGLPKISLMVIGKGTTLRGVTRGDPLCHWIARLNTLNTFFFWFSILIAFWSFWDTSDKNESLLVLLSIQIWYTRSNTKASLRYMMQENMIY